MMNLWHGSEYKFDEFDTSKIGTGDGRSKGGWGFYFSDSKAVANRYYLPKGQLDLWQVEVRPNRMFNFDGYDGYDAVLHGLDGSSIESQAAQFRDDYGDCNNSQIYDWLVYAFGTSKEAAEFLKDLGYDGVVMRDKWNTEATNYIMFDTSRIRGKVEDSEMYEDGEVSPGPGYSTLDSVPGMGAPALPTRTSTGSGDVPMPSRRTKRFKEFKKTRKKK
jgi:hypothetical protein